MVNHRTKSVGAYSLRLTGGVAVIPGILGAFTTLSQHNLVGIIISAVFIAGGAYMLKRSGTIGRSEPSATRLRQAAGGSG